MQDARQEWDSVCGNFHFYPTNGSGITSSTTFAQAYYGSNFRVEFAGILAAVAGLMSTVVPPFDGDEVMITELQNWPDS